MYKIQQITSDPSQQQVLVLPDSSQISLAMSYAPGQQTWNMSITYGTFVLNGVQVVNNPNLLQQWRNIIPFGLGCFSSAAREPSQLLDFSTGYAELYVLSADDVAAYNEALRMGTASL